MPELPEVQTTARGLNSRVLKRTFVDVWSDWEKIVKKPKDFKVFKKEIKGKKIIKIWRRAKNIIFDLSQGYSLLVHQKMTGHLMVGEWKQANNKWRPIKKGPLEEKINTFLHVIFFLENGKMIALSDVRKFAKIELWKTKDLLNSKEFNKLGPEPLEKSFTFEKFKEALKGKKRKIKQVLMDPEIIAGIGNIYSNEALWWAKINPQKNTLKLDLKELRLLYDSIRKVLLAGVRLGGESFSDYRNVKGKKGHFDDERKVYKRENEKCSRCGTLIKRLKFGGRSAFFCPKCQKV
ncbi:MAG: DNA-formamidopyrimidine glycosylase [Candidatus Staskawiczbacteria bacterium]|nr:DNA-formamidopyrimidine glycosylase [Candidatus Staskawiczbacteria bacterium]